MNRLRALGPAVPRPATSEVFRAAMGAGFGLACCAVLLWGLAPAGNDLIGHPLLIAPFGASAFLIFAVPNSPLAQPWAVVVGNSLSALAGLVVVKAGLSPVFAAPIAVSLAMIGMSATRSLHPPGGAVALFTALAAPAAWSFAASPVLIGSLCLVAAGTLWNRLTGRAYPFRQPATSPHGTADARPERRHLPAPGALADLLARLRLDANIGVEDLTRLITAAEAEAATRPLAGLTARHLMSRDLITVAPTTPLSEIVALFQRHRFKTLPMVNAGKYAGLVSEESLLGQADADLTAADLAHDAPGAAPDTPAAEMVQRLADGREQALPITQNGHLVGLVTRSDLIALLARSVQV